MKLYNFHRSSASFRVRIGLALKGLSYEYVAVELGWERSQNLDPAFAKINPQRLLPVLVDGEVAIAQSLAILEYLEEVNPTPPLLPRDRAGRARVRSIAYHIASEIQPLNNLRVEKYLTSTMGTARETLATWRRHWITEGFAAVEAMLAQRPGKYCHGDTPTLADCCLVPQVFNARRATADLAPFPHVQAVFDTCMAHQAFQESAPERQPDGGNVAGTVPDPDRN